MANENRVRRRALNPDTPPAKYRRGSVRSAASSNLACGCPGTMAKTIERESIDKDAFGNQRSELKQWPIQLTLIPVVAPYLKGADLVLLADCTAVAYANLHRDFVKDKVIAMACPKLDNTDPYVNKLAQMMKINDFNSIEVIMMEVPCCGSLASIVERACAQAGVDIDVKKTVITLEGRQS